MKFPIGSNLWCCKWEATTVTDGILYRAPLRAAKAADEALLAHEVVHALSGLSRVALKKEDNPPASRR